MRYSPHIRFTVLAVVAATAGTLATENIGFGIMVFFGLAAIVLPILGALRGDQEDDPSRSTKDQ